MMRKVSGDGEAWQSWLMTITILLAVQYGFVHWSNEALFSLTRWMMIGPDGIAHDDGVTLDPLEVEAMNFLQ